MYAKWEFNCDVEKMIKVHNLSHNQDLRDFHRNFCDAIKQIHPPFVNAEFHQMLIEYVESYHAYVVSENPYQIHHSDIAKAIVMFFQQHIELRLDILAAFKQLTALRNSLKLSGRSDYDARKIEDFYRLLKTIDQYLQEEQKYRSPEMNLSIGLQDLLSKLTQCYLPFDLDVCCLINKIDAYYGGVHPNHEYRDRIHDQICQDYMLEALDLVFKVVEEQDDKYLRYTLIHHLYENILSRKDKRLNQPEILLRFAVNFELHRERFGGKSIIQHIVSSFKKLAKAKKLNDELVQAFKELKIYDLKNENRGIKPSRLYDMQEDVDLIIYDYEQEHGLTKVKDVSKKKSGLRTLIEEYNKGQI